MIVPSDVMLSRSAILGLRSMLLASAFRQLVDRRFVAFYTILVRGNLKSLAVVVFHPNAVLPNVTVLYLADAM
jgi:hypothetical protein